MNNNTTTIGSQETSRCAYCDGDFTYIRQRKPRKFCSNKCAGRYKNKKKKLNNSVSKNCTMCKSPFLTYQDNKFCSGSCAAYYHSNKTIELSCRNCNGKFTGKQGSLYCGEECKRDYYNKNKLHNVNCHYCNRDFETNYKKQKYCSLECSGLGTNTKVANEREINFRYRFNKKFKEFTYVKGYIHSDKNVTVRCGDSHHEFEINARVIRQKEGHIINCPECTSINSALRNLTRTLKRLKECEVCDNLFMGLGFTCSWACREKREDRVYRELRERKAENFVSETLICKECDDTFQTEYGKKNRVFCSHECSNRNENRRNEINRRRKLKDNGQIDYSITLERLAKRDKDICYICNDKVDFNLDGNDDYYPSVDHVIPVSKGGTHTWGNVKLAHRRCNYKKGASYPNEIVEVII